MKCKYCEREIQDGSQFCTYCGQRVSSPPGPNLDQTTARTVAESCRNSPQETIHETKQDHQSRLLAKTTLSEAENQSTIIEKNQHAYDETGDHQALKILFGPHSAARQKQGQAGSQKTLLMGDGHAGNSIYPEMRTVSSNTGAQQLDAEAECSDIRPNQLYTGHLKTGGKIPDPQANHPAVKTANTDSQGKNPNPEENRLSAKPSTSTLTEENNGYYSWKSSGPHPDSRSSEAFKLPGTIHTRPSYQPSKEAKKSEDKAGKKNRKSRQTHHSEPSFSYTILSEEKPHNLGIYAVAATAVLSLLLGIIVGGNLFSGYKRSSHTSPIAKAEHENESHHPILQNENGDTYYFDNPSRQYEKPDKDSAVLQNIPDHYTVVIKELQADDDEGHHVWGLSKEKTWFLLEDEHQTYAHCIDPIPVELLPVTPVFIPYSMDLYDTPTSDGLYQTTIKANQNIKVLEQQDVGNTIWLYVQSMEDPADCGWSFDLDSIDISNLTYQALTDLTVREEPDYTKTDSASLSKDATVHFLLFDISTDGQVWGYIQDSGWVPVIDEGEMFFSLVS